MSSSMINDLLAGRFSDPDTGKLVSVGTRSLVIEKTLAGNEGDLVHALAHPIARTLDAILGTDLKNCPACHKRREDWNTAIPFHPPAQHPIVSQTLSKVSQTAFGFTPASRS